MMLQIMSDVHLEYSKFTPLATDADIIILAGDIALGNKGVFWAREKFPDKRIVYVPGNHEFYNSNRIETLKFLRIAGKQNNVQVLDENEFVLKKECIRFLGCTLWTNFEYFGAENKVSAMISGQDDLNDFCLIEESGTKSGIFTPEYSVRLHHHALNWLNTKLDEPFDGITVVITHHLPSKLSVSDKYKNNPLTPCFASELDELFGKMNLWIHGHTHDSFDYVVNGTRVICNPRGYVIKRKAENLVFNPGLVVEI